MFLDILYYKDCSIYKHKKSLFKKLQPFHPLIGLNDLIFAATNKAELMANSIKRQFTTNPDRYIPDISKTFHYIKNLKIIKSNLFTASVTVKSIIHNV